MCARLEEIPKLHAKMSNAIKRIITVISLGRKFRLLSRYPRSLSFETAAAFGTKSPDVPRDFVTAEGAAGQGRGGRIAGWVWGPDVAAENRSQAVKSTAISGCRWLGVNWKDFSRRQQEPGQQKIPVPVPAVL